MLFYQQKCCSQQLVHCNSSSSDPPLLPAVLRLSCGVCKLPCQGTKHGVPHERDGIGGFLGKRLGVEEVPTKPDFAAVPAAVPLWVQAGECKLSELEGTEGLLAAVWGMGYCTAGREESIMWREGMEVDYGTKPHRTQILKCRLGCSKDVS